MQVDVRSIALSTTLYNDSSESNGQFHERVRLRERSKGDSAFFSGLDERIMLACLGSVTATMLKVPLDLSSGLVNDLDVPVAMQWTSPRDPRFGSLVHSSRDRRLSSGFYVRMRLKGTYCEV